MLTSLKHILGRLILFCIGPPLIALVIAVVVVHIIPCMLGQASAMTALGYYLLFES